MAVKKYNTFYVIALSLLLLIAGVYVLYIGASLLIPFIISILLSFLLLSITNFYHALRIPKIFSFILSLITVGFIFYIIGLIINENIGDILDSAPEYQEKLESLVASNFEKYNIDGNVIKSEIISKLDITALVSNAASIITLILKNVGIIFFFTVFILLESTAFRTKLSLITGGEKSTFFMIYNQISADIKSYFFIKTITSLCVAFLSALIMFAWGLDFLVFWAFLIFLLNYIPNVGSIIAVSFPVLFSLIQFDSLYGTTIFLILMTIAQVIIGNLVEPRLMGNRLNLSPLVILFSLIFWGTIWGPIGMLLSVPIMVMINIVLSHISATRPIAILLSEKGIIKFRENNKISQMSLKKMKKILKTKD